MARRKRLTPPRSDYLAAEPPAPTGGPLAMPPIAQVAGEAASSAALQTLSDEMSRARAEGRFIEALPLAAIAEDYLVRDRIGVSPEEQAALLASLRERGQQTPIEVVDLGDGRYGLIAGWRRLLALRTLSDETQEGRFGTIQARVTRPGETAEAYRSMVEENEIRVGLSHYERARIALRAVEEGVFPDESSALGSLYSTASRAKKSKIRSFISVVRALDGVLRFPMAIGERLGLRLAKALAEDHGAAERISTALKSAQIGRAEVEQMVLEQALTHPIETEFDAELAPEQPEGIVLRYSRTKGEVRLLGSGVSADFVRDLKAWLAERD